MLTCIGENGLYMYLMLGGGEPGGRCRSHCCYGFLSGRFATYSFAWLPWTCSETSAMPTSSHPVRLFYHVHMFVWLVFNFLLALSGMSASSLFFSFHMRYFSPKFDLQRTNRDFIFSPRGEQGPAGQGEGIASSCP